MIVPLILNMLILSAKSDFNLIYRIPPIGECSPYSIGYLFFSLPPHSMLHFNIEYNYGVWFITDLPWDSGNQNQVIHNYTPLNWDCGFYRFESQVHHTSLSFVIIVPNLISISIYILPCPQNCQYCVGQNAQCIEYLFKFATFWHQTVETDGWTIDNNLKMQIFQYGSIKIAGGQVSQMGRIFQDIPYHFSIQIKFKLWTFSQNYVNYTLSLDDTQYYIQQYPKYDQQVGITNAEILQNHSSTDLKLKLQRLSNTQHSWGVNTVELVIAKCIIYCEKCYGPSIQECTVCIKGWMYFKGNCLPVPLILVSMIIKVKPKIQNQNQNFPFHISIDEGKKYFYDVGLNDLEINQDIKNITFTIQANCFQIQNIGISFKSCYQCLTQQQYKQTHKCTQNINFVTYHVTYSLEIESPLKLIINLQKDVCEISQVISAYGNLTKFLILKITKSNS